MYFVYVLWSEKLRKRYVGMTEDVEKRMNQHNMGMSPFTKRGIPWELIHREEYPSKVEAHKRELFLKSGKGRSWLDGEFILFTRKSRTQTGSS